MKTFNLHIKPLYTVLLTVGLLLLVGGAIALFNHPAVWYEYVYGFKIAELEEVNNAWFSSTLAKGEIIRGKLVVEYGEVIFVITKGSDRVVDSGRIQAGKSFHFSIRSDFTYTGYIGLFSFSDDADAKFYCNLNPEISDRLDTNSLPGLLQFETEITHYVFEPAKLK